jgi:hypothetical protein
MHLLKLDADVPAIAANIRPAHGRWVRKYTSLRLMFRGHWIPAARREQTMIAASHEFA